MEVKFINFNPKTVKRLIVLDPILNGACIYAPSTNNFYRTHICSIVLYNAWKNMSFNSQKSGLCDYENITFIQRVN
jgi:hypothetical protein